MHKSALGEYIFFIAIAFFIAFLFFVSAPLQDALLDVVVFFGGYVGDHPILGSLIFIGLAAGSAFLSPFSSAPLVPVAVLIWGNAATSGMLFAGWMIGDMIAYVIGAYAGKPVLRYVIAEEKLEYYRSRIPTRAEFPLRWCFVSPCLPRLAGMCSGRCALIFGSISSPRFWRSFHSRS